MNKTHPFIYSTYMTTYDASSASQSDAFTHEMTEKLRSYIQRLILFTRTKNEANNELEIDCPSRQNDAWRRG